MGRGPTVDLLPIDWLRFQLPFFKSLKFSFNHSHHLNANYDMFSVFAQPDMNTRGIGRIRGSYATVIQVNINPLTLTIIV